MILNNIIKILEEKLKLKTPEQWDNSGLQIGSLNNDVNKIMIALDLDKEAVSFAIDNNINLIITHHPFIFSSIKSIDYDTYTGEIIRALVNNNINIYSMHTSLDMAEYGVNHELASKLGFDKYDVLHVTNEHDGSGYGGISNINPINIIEYANIVKSSLECSYVKLYYDNDKKIIKRVAFCGGNGSDFIEEVINKGADLYITGDMKYHQAQDALKNNLSIIDAGHYNTEYHSLIKIKHIIEEYTLLETILIKRNSVQEMLIV